MSKNFLYFLIVVLLVFNGLLVAKGARETRSSMFVSLLSPFKEFLVNKSPEKFLNDEIYGLINSGDKRFYVITIIQERGCSSCIREEEEAINRLSRELSDQLIVVQIGENKKALKNSGLKMNYLFYESFDEVFNSPVDLNSLNPISLVLDKNFIFDVRKVDVTKPKDDFLTESFYIYIENLFTH